MIDIFIPSYHRAENLKTVKYFLGIGYDPKKIHVIIDNETDDQEEYESVCKKLKINLHVFDFITEVNRYNYIHRKSHSQRSVGMARNGIYDIAEKLGISFFLIFDDDTNSFERRDFGKYGRKAKGEEVLKTFEAVKIMMQKHKIGVFGLSQTGDMFEKINTKIIRLKVMNTTFYDTRFIYRGERGVMDPDTSLFVGLLNEGYFTGSMATGIVLQQTASATAKGGLTDLYNECKLLNKSLIVPIQFPSLCQAEKQTKNGGRLHHRIKYRNLAPKLIKGDRNNLPWDSYPEDVPFTNEPKREK